MDKAESRGSIVIPAPYGQACTACARSKYRCMYRSDRRQCERCHRLNKECVQPVSARRLASKGTLTGSRVADLEGKIDSLMALLQSQAAEKAQAQSHAAALVTPALSGGEDSHHTEAAGSSVSSNHSSPEVHSHLRRALDRPQADFLSLDVELQPRQAENCLSYFRSYMLSLFPFMHIRPDTTARQLREVYPFLWINIIAVTARHVTGQYFLLTDRIKRFVAHKTVVENEVSLDLLLGLLVFICWYHFHNHNKGSSCMTVMTSLARSLIIDLKLNNGSGEAQASLPCLPAPPQNTASISVGRRAVLAHFLLLSQISHTRKGIDVPEWTPYLDGCLQTLSQYPECPGDEQLTAQIRIQLLADQIRRGPWKNHEIQISASYVGGLQSQLEKMKVQLPRNVMQNERMSAATITDHLLHSELALQDALISKPPVSPYSPNYQRQELLETHLTTITRVFDQFFAIPPDQYPGITFSHWCRMAHGLTLLHRLYVLDDPSWDCSLARDRVDLFALGGRLAGILTETGGGQQRKSQDDNNMFLRCSRVIQSMCSAWWAELQSSERRQQSGEHQSGQLQNIWITTNMNADLGNRSGLSHGDMAFEMMTDDIWLSDIFNVS